MSQSRREARREARRAESPPNPRDRRRRRLNSTPDQTRPTGPVFSWLDQQEFTRPTLPAQTTNSVSQLPRFQTLLHNINQFHNSNSGIGQTASHSLFSMQDQDTLMEGQTAGPSSTYHPSAVVDPDDQPPSILHHGRSLNSRRDGPLLALDQIVSKDQPVSAGAELPSPYAIADSDDVQSDSTEDSYQGYPSTLVSLGHSSSARNASRSGPQIFYSTPRNMQLTFNGWGEERERETDRPAKRSACPESPTILLPYQMDRNTPHPTLRFLPFIPVSEKKNSKNKNKRFMIQPSHKQRIDATQLTARRAQWVPGKLPVELFELVTQHLSRDDIKSMRLVNKEFELGVSHSLFDTVVVPFNTELYEMIEQKVVKRDLKGKRRADDPVNNFIDLEPGSLLWKNALADTEDKVYRGHGLKVFEGFGGHIRRFGMSFEIKEEALQNPPQKNQLDRHESYFGWYEWPSQEYTRYEQLAGLERTADETSQMKLAFSHLSKVQQLALSMDSGLGWMTGPDKSLRSLILQRPSPLFGCSHGIVDAQQQERIRLWESLETAHDRLDALEDLKEGHLERVNMEDNFFHRLPFSTTPYASPALWATAPADAVAISAAGILDGDDHEVPETGVLYVTASDAHDHSSSSVDAQRSEMVRKIDKFNPNGLGNHQKEWLLEAEWAQRAFLTTYMLGVVDNSPVFDNVSVLNFRISSHLAPLLSRHDFWTSLPKLQEVTLAVIPDWRTVERDDAGVVETKDVDPSLAAEKTYALLQDFIGVRPNITKLSFSWAAGGEHAEGIFARNHHILPAPITSVARSTTIMQNDDHLINLPHIKDLTFSNCWFTPISIVAMVKKLRRESLRKIKFDSVSLTAMPRPNTNAAGGPGNPFMIANAGNNQAPAPPAPVGGNVAALFGAQVWQGPPTGTPVQQWAQTMLQNMNLLTQHGIVLQQIPQVMINHPMGMTMQQIMGMLTVLSTGNGQGTHPMAQPGTLYQQPQQQGGAAQSLAIPAVPAAPPPPVGWPMPPQPGLQAPPPPANTLWYEGHRSGSWVKVIDKISPGPTLEMYQPRDEFEPEPERRKKGLASLEFNSCGYVQLRSTTFDQNNVEAPIPHRMSRHFTRRQTLLSSAMLSTTDKLVGTIVQYMSEHESDALHHAWGMRMGWDDAKLAEEAEYDGYLAGGTGRFSGGVTKDTPIQEAYAAGHA